MYSLGALYKFNNQLVIIDGDDKLWSLESVNIHDPESLTKTTPRKPFCTIGKLKFYNYNGNILLAEKRVPFSVIEKDDNLYAAYIDGENLKLFSRHTGYSPGCPT